MSGRTASPPAPPMGFRLATPGNWFDLDLDPRTRNESIAAMVDAHIARSAATPENRQVLVRLLRRTARDAADRGMVFASLMSEVAEGIPVSASATVTLSGALDSEERSISDPSRIATELRTKDGGAGRRREVSVVDLPAGRAVRLVGTRTGDVEGIAEGIVTHEVQSFVPVPGTRLLAVLTFTTPVLALAEPFTGLFDTMAQNFAFEWADDVAVRARPGENAGGGDDDAE